MLLVPAVKYLLLVVVQLAMHMACGESIPCGVYPWYSPSFPISFKCCKNHFWCSGHSKHTWILGTMCLQVPVIQKVEYLELALYQRVQSLLRFRTQCAYMDVVSSSASHTEGRVPRISSVPESYFQVLSQQIWRKIWRRCRFCCRFNFKAARHSGG